MTRTENWATTTHSHCRETNSRQPSRSSASTECPPPAARSAGVRRSSAISTAATANIAPLAVRAHPPPSRTTAAPLSTRPATREMFCPSPSSAFAVCSRSAGTTSGMIPVRAGNRTAAATPLTALAVTRAGSGVQPVSIIAARQKYAAALSDSPAIMTR